MMVMIAAFPQQPWRPALTRSRSASWRRRLQYTLPCSTAAAAGAAGSSTGSSSSLTR